MLGKGDFVAAKPAKLKKQTALSKRQRDDLIEDNSPSVPAPPPKKPSGPRVRYVEGTADGDRMALAIGMVSKGMSQSRAAELHGVNREALGRIHRGDQLLFSTSGPAPVLHKQLEDDLHEYVIFVFRAGFGLDWGSICDLAVKLARAMEISDFYASPGWLAGFKHRYPDLVRRRAQSMERVRAGAMNVDSVDKYFNDVLKFAYDFVEEKNGEPINPGASLNLDESAVQSKPGNKYVVCPRGSTEVKSFSQGKGIHNTLTSVIYADGTMEEPFWIVAGVNSQREWCDAKGNVTNEKLGAVGKIAMAPKGYMTDEVCDFSFDWLIVACCM